MNSQIVDAVTEWDTASFGGGYDGVNDLANAEFSGAITTASTWAFMLNGNVIGVVDGSITAFDGADGTAYEAPDPSLPLLYTMQCGDSEKQAEYYTKDTAISEANDTLSSGNFTGYIKLSENVHSGDYYIVYYGGRSMSVAFVGNSRQLFTGDDAFERADEEIGIYRVYAADIDVVDVPETETQTETATGSGVTVGDTSPDDDDNKSNTTAASDGNQGSTPPPGRRPTDTPETATSGGGANAPTGGEPDATTAGSGTPDDTTTTASTEPPAADTTAASSTEPTDTAQSPGDADGDRAANGGLGQTQTAGGSATAGASENGNRFSEESEWQNTTTIPSLDPDEEATSSRGQTGGGQALTQRSTKTDIADTEGQPSRKQLTKRLEEAEAVMEKAEKRHKQLIEARDTARRERDEAREERDAAREKIAELETKLEAAKTEIDQLESQLAEAEEAAEAAAAEPTPSAAAAADVDSGHTLDPVSALEGTSLFVRYDSKGAATLDTAHEGKADPDELSENLRIDSHTTFETEGLTVDGDPFDEFLENRIEVAFADWIVRDLLYDIQGTGTQSGMRRIYDAIPKIDRIELRGTVELGTDEDDEPIELPYDLIVRDKHGNPLFVATFEESKAAVGGDVVEEVIQDGSDIRGREKEFVAGFTVTTSYFDPGALEAAEDATSGGFLSRSRGKSFVSLSRKRGFHLCLVDRIEDGFDLRVPEL